MTYYDLSYLGDKYVLADKKDGLPKLKLVEVAIVQLLRYTCSTVEEIAEEVDESPETIQQAIDSLLVKKIAQITE